MTSGSMAAKWAFVGVKWRTTSGPPAAFVGPSCCLLLLATCTPLPPHPEHWFSTLVTNKRISLHHPEIHGLRAAVNCIWRRARRRKCRQSMEKKSWKVLHGLSYVSHTCARKCTRIHTHIAHCKRMHRLTHTYIPTKTHKIHEGVCRSPSHDCNFLLQTPQ